MITFDPFAADALPGWFALAAAILFIVVGKWRDWFGSERVVSGAARKSGEDALRVGAMLSSKVVAGMKIENVTRYGVVDLVEVVNVGAKSTKRRRKVDVGDPKAGSTITKQAAPRKTG